MASALPRITTTTGTFASTNLALFWLLFISFHALALTSAASCVENNITAFFGATDHADYIQWATSVEGGCERYENYMFLSTTTDINVGAAIHWRLDVPNEMMYVAVAVKIDSDDRWVGLGLSELGGMFGTDLALYESSKPSVIQDGYILDERQPFIDTKPTSTSSSACGSDDSDADGTQDWNYVNVTSTPTFLIIEMNRALNTGDAFDHKIVNDGDVEVPVHRVVVAWGETSSVSYHGENKVRGAIRWFSNKADSKALEFVKIMEEQADGYVDFIVPNYAIPNLETTYASFCYFYDNYDWPDSTHIIGYDVLLGGEVGRAHIHHFVLHASRVTESEVTDCFNNLPSSEVMWPWAPGEPAFAFPDYLTVSVGPSSNSKLISFRLQVHYNNPDGTSGLVDNSGVRLYYSSKARQYEAAVLQLGDPSVALSTQQVGTGITEHTFTCQTECSKLALNQFNSKKPVTVIREYLHMHEKGTSIRNDLIRGDNGDIVHTGQIEYWDFTQQGDAAVVQTPFQIEPGDVFRTSCYYSNTDNSLIFGQATSEEMCMAFLMYYPRLQTPQSWVCGYKSAPADVCLPYYKNNVIPDKTKIPRSFGLSKCATTSPSDTGPCPERNRCSARFLSKDKVKYSVSTNSRFRGCLTKCISENLIPLWERLGYRCGSCP